jgi:hypothetical protein
VGTTKLIADLHRQALVAVDRNALRSLVAAADVLREDDTCVAGWIRVLAVEGLILVQEETPDGDVLVRRMPSRQDAESFVEYRMASYERMWDGCGCRIDYLAEWQGDTSDATS